MSLKGKRILFIAPASIPVNSPEAIVNFKQLEILSKEGCIIDVVSRRIKKSHYPFSEATNNPFKLNSVHILEVGSSITLQTVILHILAFLKFGVSFRGAHWACIALPLCKKLVELNQYDAVMTKSLPSELVGYWLKKKKGIKWIATWNDPYPVEKYPFPYGKGPYAKVELGKCKLLKIMENYPDFHLFPSERLRNYMLQYLNISLDKTCIIPHIVTDINEQKKVCTRNSDTLTLLHSGDVRYPRDPYPLLQAISVFHQRYPLAKLKISFLGLYSNKMSSMIKDLKIDSIVELLPPASYILSMKKVLEYDVALIIEAPCEEGIFLPTKVGDYMQLGKVIFSISPSSGVLSDLYNTNHIGYFADCTSVSSILNEITCLYHDYSLNKLKQTIVPEEFLPNSILKNFEKII